VVGNLASPLVGILALQGGFAAHAQVLSELGTESKEVRTVSDLSEVDALILPGGESTTIMIGLEREGLINPIREQVTAGMPVLGTCAGLIVLSRGYLDLIDIEIERNAYGRQIHSFETELKLCSEIEVQLHGVFIRAPKIKAAARDVETLVEFEDEPVAVRQHNVFGASFHPELAADTTLHKLFLENFG